MHVLCCVVLYCVVLCCVVYCFVLHYIVLYCIVLSSLKHTHRCIVFIIRCYWDMYGCLSVITKTLILLNPPKAKSVHDRFQRRDKTRDKFISFSVLYVWFCLPLLITRRSVIEYLQHRGILSVFLNNKIRCSRWKWRQAPPKSLVWFDISPMWTRFEWQQFIQTAKNHKRIILWLEVSNQLSLFRIYYCGIYY